MSTASLAARGLVAGAAFLLAFAGPTMAVERWGKVESVDARFNKFTLVQDGTRKVYEIRINADTSYVLLDGRTAAGLPIEQLKGLRVFAIVQENPGHYAMKIWVRPDVAPEEDPINPGVGAVLR